MQYNRLGNSGLVVSRIALGTSTFGEGDLRMAYVNQQAATAMVSMALDAGVNLFDSSDVYNAGQSEQMLGKALQGRREQAIVTTKVGGHSGKAVTQRGLSRQHIIEAAHNSLRRLGTDYIDLYLAHRMDPYTPLEETLEAFDHLVKSGKVLYTGFSNWTAWLAATAAGLQRQHGWAGFCVSESYYSLLGRDVEHELVPMLRHSGMGLLVWAPLLMGFLSGKYTREDPTGGKGRADGGLSTPPFDRELGYRVVDRMREIAAHHNAKPAQVALAWLLAKPWVSSLLIGASKIEQYQDNLAAMALKLEDAEIAALDEITQPPALYPRPTHELLYSKLSPGLPQLEPSWRPFV